MADPPSDAQPFSEAAANRLPGGAGGEEARLGCSKPVLVGCGAILLLLVLGLVLIVENRDRLFRTALNQTRQQIVEGLPTDLEVEERQRLGAAFDAVADAVTGGHVDLDGVQKLQEALAEARRRLAAGGLNRQDVLDLTSRLEAISGPSPASHLLPRRLGLDGSVSS